MAVEMMSPGAIEVERRIPMSYDEFLALPDSTHAEWVNGEGIIFMPPTDRHQDVVRFLAEFIGAFVRLFGLGVTRFAPYEVRLIPGRASREPDFLFVANEHRDRITDKGLEGAPDLIVELISPRSVHRDRVDKFDEYEAAGVREYWVIDPRPEHQRAWFYVLSEEGKLIEQGLQQGRFYSTVLQGLWLRVDWLWQDTLPNEMHCLRDIVGAQTLMALFGKMLNAE